MTIQIRTKNINVSLIGNRADNAACLDLAWKVSRPLVREEALDAPGTLSIDAPIGDIPSVVAIFDIPIVFRELLVGMRDHVMWARSSRVDNLLEAWEVLPGAEDQVKGLAEQMELAANRSDRQDDYRLYLPISYMTSVTMRLGVRTAVKVAEAFKRLGQGFGLRHSLAVAAEELSFLLRSQLIDLWVPYDQMAAKMRPLELLHPMKDPRFGLRVSETSEIIVVKSTVSIALRSQLVRHRALIITDTLDGILRRNDVLAIPLSFEMTTEVAGTRPAWAEIASQRNCWVAQTDLWAPILSQINTAFSSMPLPCSDGVCPFSGDCKLRIEKRDPNPPCPRQIALDASEVKGLVAQHWPDHAELVGAIGVYAALSDRDEAFWCNQTDEMTRELVNQGTKQ